MRKIDLFALAGAVSIGLAGCANKQIVRAAPPSVSMPPPEQAPPPPPPEAPPTVEQPPAEPPPDVPAPAPPPAPAKRTQPPRPRSAPAETAEPEPAPAKPAPPQISPQLSGQALENAKAQTASNITTSEHNLQLTSGRQLSAAQQDLVGKISGFLSQAHEAIKADDWVKAQNLAEKARVLSAELVKTL